MKLAEGFWVPLLCVLWSSVSALRPFTSAPYNCSQQGLRCDVSLNNCLLDKSWLKVRNYTPSGPRDLALSVSAVPDPAGRLHPLLFANWTLRDDGSIRYLKATELHVMVEATNQHLCVRYSFKDKLRMRNPHDEKWSFSANMLALEPGHTYWVSVFNIPKPEMGHSDYDVRKKLAVPGCQDPAMRATHFCVERGSLWESDVGLLGEDKDGLTVSFSPDPRCQEYLIIVNCASVQHTASAFKVNQSRVSVWFGLEKWPRSCCQFDVWIKPLFPKCGQDCTRHSKTLHLCSALAANSAAAPKPPRYRAAVAYAALPCLAGLALFLYVRRRKPGKAGAGPVLRDDRREAIPQSPKVLVIYSQDHPLYRDIVLKLCAFLRAQCGAEVLLDLLDGAGLGALGRLPWLERQRRRLNRPGDKVLVLCSRGVQAKWRAMCGQRRVRLREDLLSPSDDMLTPFLNLFLPDMQRARQRGKYAVAYFSEVSGERDVPSVLDAAVKYALMKHFEELYFGLLDVEKYPPGGVRRIPGLAEDEYFKCPSGLALKKAIQTFAAYQKANPDWFEKECVEREEDLLPSGAEPGALRGPPLLRCAPLLRDGLPLYQCRARMEAKGDPVRVFTPELNAESSGPSVVEPLRRSRDDPPGEEGHHVPPVEESSPLGSGPSPEPRVQPERKPGTNGGSDQGYISKMPSPLGTGQEEDPLLALARLQEELFLQTLDSSHSNFNTESVL
ncbi:interleukin 17 receptor A1a [Stigmatopora nigra]